MSPEAIEIARFRQGQYTRLLRLCRPLKNSNETVHFTP